MVSRPSKWGNPFKAGQVLVVADWHGADIGLIGIDIPAALALYRCHVVGTFGAEMIQSELRGSDLACWCPLDKPCHADVLLELANLETA